MRTAKSIKDVDGLAMRMLALEEEAYKEFAEIFGPRLKAFFYRRGLSLSDAEDLAATCVTDISLKVEKYKQIKEGGFGAWVYTLAYHALSDWLSAQPTMEPLRDDLAVKEQPAEDEERDLSVIFAVREAISRLPEADQLLLHLRDLGPEHSYKEVGQELGISPEAARVRHFRILNRLKSILEKDARITRRLKSVGRNGLDKDNE